eukprot:scpid41825/ scgid30863/ Glycosyltransferase-like protein LARGE2; Glycosyltransferase-like 1B
MGRLFLLILDLLAGTLLVVLALSQCLSKVQYVSSETARFAQVNGFESIGEGILRGSLLNDIPDSARRTRPSSGRCKPHKITRVCSETPVVSIGVFLTKHTQHSQVDARTSAKQLRRELFALLRAFLLSWKLWSASEQKDGDTEVRFKLLIISCEHDLAIIRAARGVLLTFEPVDRTVDALDVALEIIDCLTATTTVEPNSSATGDTASCSSGSGESAEGRASNAANRNSESLQEIAAHYIRQRCMISRRNVLFALGTEYRDFLLLLTYAKDHAILQHSATMGRFPVTESVRVLLTIPIQPQRSESNPRLNTGHDLISLSSQKPGLTWRLCWMYCSRVGEAGNGVEMPDCGRTEDCKDSHVVSQPEQGRVSLALNSHDIVLYSLHMKTLSDPGVRACQHLWTRAWNMLQRSTMITIQSDARSSQADVDALNDGVALLTQVSTDRLHNLETLCERWPGPIDFAIHVQDQKSWQLTKETVRSCSCWQRLRAHLVYQNASAELSYPVNFLRNIVLSRSTAEFVFILDFDFIPSVDCYRMLQERIRTSDSWERQVLVVPAFQVQIADAPMPSNKIDMLRMLADGTAMQFHGDKFPPAHQPTNIGKWKSAAQLYPVQWQLHYEPYILAKRAALPNYDMFMPARFGNKASHIMHMDALGFQFYVHPHAFVVHRSHVPACQTRRLTGCVRRLQQDFVTFLEEVCSPCAKNRYSGFNMTYSKFMQQTGKLSS